MEGEMITMHDVFVFEKTGLDADGKVIGQTKATGVRPKSADKIKAAGHDLPASLFEGPDGF